MNEWRLLVLFLIKKECSIFVWNSLSRCSLSFSLKRVTAGCWQLICGWITRLVQPWHEQYTNTFPSPIEIPSHPPVEFFALTSAQLTFETPCTARAMLQACSLHRTATHCNALQHTPTHSNTLQRTATRCNRLHHRNALLHIATHCNTPGWWAQEGRKRCCTARSTQCIALQHTGVICGITHPYVTRRIQREPHPEAQHDPLP